MINNGLHRIFATVLLALLVFPLALESYHASWHQHEPIDCKVTQAHIHQDQVDCSLDDLQLSPFHYELYVPGLRSVAVVTRLELTAYESRIDNSLHSFLRDRGPPRFSL